MQYSFDNDLQLNLEAYKSSIEMSDRKRLLVEGSDDEKFFRILQDNFVPPFSFKFDIDTAENITSDSPLGNRQKVENIAEGISNQPYSYRFVGFIDREFREFTLETLTDDLGCHKQESRIVWSRGHSIENYFFDCQMLCKFLKTSFKLNCHKEAIKNFENSFQQIICIACAIGLAGHKVGKERKISEAIYSNVFEMQSNKVFLRIESWEKILIERRILTQQELLIFIDSYQSYLQRLTDTNFEIVRWLCYGHAGLNVIWGAYSCLVYEATSKIRVDIQEKVQDFKNQLNNTQEAGDEINKKLKKLESDLKVNNPKKQAQKVFDGQDIRIESLTYCLVAQASRGECVYPSEVIRLLEVNVC